MQLVWQVPKRAALLFHLVAMATLVLYCAYRLSLGHWPMVFIYSLSLIPLTLSFVKELRGQSSPVNRMITLLLVSIGIAATCLEIGYAGMIFIFPAIFIYFFLFNIRAALMLSSLFTALCLICGAQVEASDVIARFGVASVNCIIFGAVFAFILAKQHDSLVQIAQRDPLTGLFNRSKLELDLAAIAPATPAVLMLLDVDHFKRINDVHGHQTGDKVLTSLGKLLDALMPDVATAYRFGGEEFLVLFNPAEPSAHNEAALNLAKTTAARFQAALRCVDAVPGSTITCSIGIAQRHTGEHQQPWFARADAALYRAKRSGRDRVCIFEEAFDGEHISLKDTVTNTETAMEDMDTGMGNR
ncbi:GGDEF domain-containing protein [Shewanella sp. FJAT-52076]|uniref:GGDEF domain-containing protein n=1 Tax=Shewanella sp. FJAT-52076 TaxID=2864202 RepID=UPI001C6618BA|nr:GGDEF domain-containing protein [Shewanella sp. FJAT-52076]QYJ76991.1 GGDEF domain-containing protein [Shewanella sp. FJAT-52076]